VVKYLHCNYEVFVLWELGHYGTSNLGSKPVWCSFCWIKGKEKRKVQLCTTKVLARRKGCLISGGVLKVKYISLNIQHIFSRTVVRSLRGHIGVMNLPLMKDLWHIF